MRKMNSKNGFSLIGLTVGVIIVLAVLFSSSQLVSNLSKSGRRSAEKGKRSDEMQAAMIEILRAGRAAMFTSTTDPACTWCKNDSLKCANKTWLKCKVDFTIPPASSPTAIAEFVLDTSGTPPGTTLVYRTTDTSGNNPVEKARYENIAAMDICDDASIKAATGSNLSDCTIDLDGNLTTNADPINALHKLNLVPSPSPTPSPAPTNEGRFYRVRLTSTTKGISNDTTGEKEAKSIGVLSAMTIQSAFYARNPAPEGLTYQRFQKVNE